MDVDVGDPVVDDVPLSPDEVDGDLDGFTAGEGDCDDGDSRSGPVLQSDLFEEKCDGVDNDCDLEIDDEGVCNKDTQFPQTLKVDVLFAIDTSVTMTPYLGRLADGAHRFLESLIGFDANVGVVTINATGAPLGELVTVDSKQFLRTDEQKGLEQARQWFVRAVTDNATVTTDSGYGMAAVSEALPRIPRENWNANFLRNDASLQIVFVSDRDDATLDPSYLQFLEDLGDLKGTTENVNIYAITQVDEYGCSGAESTETQGDQYIMLSGAMEGWLSSICDADYGPSLFLLGQDVATAGLNSRFVLDPPAQLGSVSIRVDVQDVGSYDYPAENHFLTPDGKTLVLTGVLPAAGSFLNVNYQRQYELD
jgi:hypothetical protein